MDLNRETVPVSNQRSSGFASLPVLSPRQQASNDTGNEIETNSLIMAFLPAGPGEHRLAMQ
jgi:hypothetical protein